MTTAARFYRLILATAAALCPLASEAWGWNWACGRWNMPSTPAQYFGYGYGPGHHAPMLRMPCCCPTDGRRLAFTPDCPQFSCNSCSVSHGNPTMYRELETPGEMMPTPAPAPETHPSQSRRVLPNAFMR